MNLSDFDELQKKSGKFAFTSLKHVGYDDLGGFSAIADDDGLILLHGENKDFGLKQCHYAFNDLNRFLARTADMSDFLMTFVDEGFVERLKSEGYEIFGVWRDYFNEDISEFGTTEGIERLKKSDYKRASEITLACKNQSRSFMGQTEEWVARWMEGQNPEAAESEMTDATILTYYENGKAAGVVCIGIYGHKSERGATLWIRELAVHPAYQRRGIATRLLQQAMGYGEMHGAKRAFLAADETNHGALKLYGKMGFVRNEDEYETAMYKPVK